MLQTVKPQRNYLIDGLRFLAAAWVVLFHFNESIPYIDNWYRNFCKYGYLGVPAFFLISGYCICIAADHSETPTDFVLKRLLRIIPPYWFSLLVVLACVVIQKIITGTNSLTILPRTLDGILCVVFLYTKPLTKYNNINWVYWTLTYELFFYLLIFLSLYLKGKIRVITLIIILSVAALIPHRVPGILFFTDQLNIFLLGVSLYNILKKKNFIGWYYLLGLLSIALMPITHQPFAWCSVALIIAGLIVLDHYRPIKKNIISKYGDTSYAIYLIHVPIGVGLLRYIKNASIQTHMFWNIVGDILMLIVIIFLSHYMHLYIEKPFINLGKKLAGNRRLK